MAQAIAMSREEAGIVEQPNTEEMTYEQLLALEESNGGSVSRGLTPSQIYSIKSKVWREKKDTKSQAEQCTICFENFKRLENVKELKKCGHAYHSKCIDKWLEGEKKCPVCKKEVL